MAEADRLGYVPQYRETEAETMRSARYAERQRRGKRRREPSRGFEFKLTVIAIILMLSLTPVASFISSYTPDEPDEARNHLDELLNGLNNELRQEAYYSAVDVLKTRAETGLNIDKLADRVGSKLNFIVQTELAGKYSDIQDWTLDIKNLSAEITIAPVLTSIDYDTGKFDAGRNYRSVPGYYNIEIRYDVEATNSETDENVNRNMALQVEIHDIYPFLEFSHDLFDLDATTPGGRIQQMVTYMLTTLVRHRLKQEYGHGPYESPFNVLNEGDIELAVNLALIFEELRLLKQYDKDALAAVDLYYRFARDPTKHADEPNWSPPNPTGQRNWGSAEMENFDKLYSHVLQSGITREYGQLLEAALANGAVADPADMFALYMILDREIPDVIIDPGDGRALLDDLNLWNPRNEADLTDANDIKMHLNLSDPFLVDMIEDYDQSWSDKSEIFTVEQSPSYLVSGKNMKVDGLMNPRGWYTDIKLTQSRTWGVPPSAAPPPQHDYRVMWDLHISGEFELNLGRLWTPEPDFNKFYKGDPQAYYTHDTWFNGTVKLDFPVNIFGWLEALPLNNGISFYNLNPLIWDFNNDTWIPTPQAQLKEYFSKRLWQDLKPFVSAANKKLNNDVEFALMNRLDQSGLINDGILLSKNDIRDRNEFQRIFATTDTFFWSELELFTEYYLRNFTKEERYWLGPKPELWLIMEGYNITIDHSEDYQDLTLTFRQYEREFKMILKGISNGTPEEFIIEIDITADEDSSLIELEDYSYVLPLISTSQPESLFQGPINDELDFELDHTPDSSIPIPGTSLNAADIYLEQQLPSFISDGAQYDIKLRIGLYKGELDEPTFSTNADRIADDMAEAAEIIFGSAGIDRQEKTTEAGYRGYFTTFVNKFVNADYNNDIKRISFDINSTYSDNSQNIRFDEFGFYISGDLISGEREINEFLTWLTFHGARLISNINGLPYTYTNIIRMVSGTDNPLDDDTIHEMSFHFITGIDEIFRVGGRLETAVFGGGAMKFYSMMGMIPFDVPYPLGIDHITSIPKYSIDRTNKDIYYLNLETRSIPITTLLLKF